MRLLRNSISNTLTITMPAGFFIIMYVISIELCNNRGLYWIYRSSRIVVNFHRTKFDRIYVVWIMYVTFLYLSFILCCEVNWSFMLYLLSLSLFVIEICNLTNYCNRYISRFTSTHSQDSHRACALHLTIFVFYFYRIYCMKDNLL